MTASAFAVRPGELAYGHICPECGSPKHRQSKRCAACYYDARRRGEYPDPPKYWLKERSPKGVYV